MRHIRLIAPVFLVIALQAWSAESPEDPVARVAAALRAAYPSTEFRNVRSTPLPGIFEVTMGRNVAYVSEDGRWFLFGHLYDMQTQRDLTAESLEQASRIDFSSLPLKDAITTRRGNGSRALAVFSDPDCPHCKKLEQELSKLDNVTIYTFLYPLESLHPDARGKAISVWCAKDRAKAWKALMLDGKVPSKTDCDHPIDRNIALAGRLGVTGTPTLINAAGHRLDGAAAGSVIENFLSKGSSR